MRDYRYTTPHGIHVTRTASKASFNKGLKHVMRDLDQHRGVYLSSGYEYPGRYSRWDVASTCPPLEIVSYDRRVEIRPLNDRGRAIVQMLHPVLALHPHWEECVLEAGALLGRLKPLPKLFPEEQRSKQPSAISIIRALIEEFRGEEDSRLGLVGAFGYDLLFQFEPIDKKLPRDGHKDLHLFLCDDIWFMDRKKEQVERYRYEFRREEVSTAGLAREAGADDVILYTSQDFEAETKRLTSGAGVDVVYDGVGKATFAQGLNCLKPRGYMVLFGQASGPVDPLNPQVLNQKGSLFLTRPTLGHYVLTREELLWRAEDLLRWLASGELKLRIDRTFPLREAPAAHQYLEDRQTKGKVLLIP
jgi:hypothetical protein